MIPISPICNVCEYSQDGVKCPPTAAQAAKGLNPLGALPSQLWNSLWHDANEAANCIKYASDTLMNEINSVLTEAGISPDVQYTDQLYQSIVCLLQTVDCTGGKSSVKSSTTPGMVSIDANGYMTVNNVGNANNLCTTNCVIVDAVNEINSTYGNAYGILWQNAYDTEDAKADIAHACCETCYGVGTASTYGHLKISDVCCCILSDCSGVAASQCALANIWAYVNSTTGLGNTLACALQTNGSAGSCTTAARSDHVHPAPVCANVATWNMIRFTPTIISRCNIDGRFDTIKTYCIVCRNTWNSIFLQTGNWANVCSLMQLLPSYICGNYTLCMRLLTCSCNNIQNNVGPTLWEVKRVLCSRTGGITCTECWYTWLGCYGCAVCTDGASSSCTTALPIFLCWCGCPGSYSGCCGSICMTPLSTYTVNRNPV